MHRTNQVPCSRNLQLAAGSRAPGAEVGGAAEEGADHFRRQEVGGEALRVVREKVLRDGGRRGREVGGDRGRGRVDLGIVGVGRRRRAAERVEGVAGEERMAELGRPDVREHGAVPKAPVGDGDEERGCRGHRRALVAAPDVGRELAGAGAVDVAGVGPKRRRDRRSVDRGDL